MAKVQIVGPRLGFQFQGPLSQNVAYTWLDEEGVALDSANPLLRPAEDDTGATAKARFTNPNTEDKTFSAPVATFGAPIATATIASFTVPAGGSVDVDVVVTFDGTQGAGDSCFLELSGESDA